MSEQAKSRYVALEVPEFKSTIPAHLLGKLSDSERFMVETMSKLENQSDFLVKAAIEGNRENLDIDVRLSAVEQWRDKMGSAEPNMTDMQAKVNKLWDWHLLLSGKWVVLWALALMVIPMLLKMLLDFVFKKSP